MPVSNRIAALRPEIEAWRRALHAEPELLYDVTDTAAFIAARLAEFGCDDVVTGIGRTGVVGLIHGRDGPGGRMNVALTWAFNVSGHPTVSVPAGTGPDGCPVGLQIVARHGADAALLDLVERVVPPAAVAPAPGRG